MWNVEKEVEEVLREVLNEAFRKGEHEGEAFVSLLDVELTGRKGDWKLIKTAYEKDILSIFKRVAKKLGLSCTFFLKVDDIPGSMYVANCTYRNTPIALAFETAEDIENKIVSIDLVSIYAKTNAQWPQGFLVHYKMLK